MSPASRTSRTKVDLAHEELLTLAEAARALPRLRNERKVHVSTLYRWISRGVRGVRLEAVRLGRTLVTSREALQRFAERLNAAHEPPAPATSSSGLEQAEREPDRHGL